MTDHQAQARKIVDLWRSSSLFGLRSKLSEYPGAIDRLADAITAALSAARADGMREAESRVRDLETGLREIAAFLGGVSFTPTGIVAEADRLFAEADRLFMGARALLSGTAAEGQSQVRDVAEARGESQHDHLAAHNPQGSAVNQGPLNMGPPTDKPWHSSRGPMASDKAGVTNAAQTGTAAEGDGWQGISTAPKDGTWFWGYAPDRSPEERQQPFRWRDRRGWIDIFDSDNSDPTYWRQLPAPPAPSAEAGEGT